MKVARPCLQCQRTVEAKFVIFRMPKVTCHHCGAVLALRMPPHTRWLSPVSYALWVATITMTHLPQRSHHVVDWVQALVGIAGLASLYRDVKAQVCFVPWEPQYAKQYTSPWFLPAVLIGGLGGMMVGMMLSLKFIPTNLAKRSPWPMVWWLMGGMALGIVVAILVLVVIQPHPRDD